MDTDFLLTLSGDVMVRFLTAIKYLAGGPIGPETRSEWDIKSRGPESHHLQS